VVTIHSSDPFATPEDLRSPVRRFRGRLPSAVTLWTAPGLLPPAPLPRPPAGLTVSSTQVVDGEPGRVLGLLDEESELWEAASATGRFTVQPLAPEDRQLADRFAGLMPAPGGIFSMYEWEHSDWGPLLAGRGTWLGCRVDDSRQMGWSILVEATVEQVTLGADAPPLIHYRGRYTGLAIPGRVR
jgi:3-hydroxy-9,10-secoandrosta-1,3,5(10)-triene-9,17-dione monooxygenase reductase component